MVLVAKMFVYLLDESETFRKFYLIFSGEIVSWRFIYGKATETSSVQTISDVSEDDSTRLRVEMVETKSLSISTIINKQCANNDTRYRRISA